NYAIAASDPDGDRLQFSAVAKPGWASLSPAGSQGARLHGRPPESASGSSTVILKVSDGSSEVLQEFNLHVNALPALSALSTATEEDTPLALPSGFFQQAYTDPNGDALAAIRIDGLPEHGVLRVGERVVDAGETIAAS